MKITKSKIVKFREYLLTEEKSPATIDKYLRDVSAFAGWLGKREVSKQTVLEYKEELKRKYLASTVNTVISSINSYFEFANVADLKIKTIKIQKKIFMEQEKELTKQEYEKLLRTAIMSGNERLFYLMQTICSTGIRVSELKFITIEAIKDEKVEISCKGKRRYVFLPRELCRMLKKYANEHKITSGPVFVTRTGNPLDRSNIWGEMKTLCVKAGIVENKVFPHNLRHLFARTYYTHKKDIVRLADVLGHSNVNTTRIYTMETGEIHRRQIQNLGLLM